MAKRDATGARPARLRGPGGGDSLRPLARLLRKERLVFMTRDRVYVFGVFFLAALQTVRVDDAYFLLGIALAGALAVYVPVIEWFHDTDRLLLSLPVRRETVVTARYLVVLAAAVIAWFAWAATGRVLLALLDPSRTTPAMWASAEGSAAYFIAVTLLASLFLPLHFRFGLGRGTVAFAGTVLGLLILGYGAADLADADVTWTAPRGPGTAMADAITAAVGRLGPGYAFVAILAVVTLVFGTSFLVSRRVFETREN